MLCQIQIILETTLPIASEVLNFNQHWELDLVFFSAPSPRQTKLFCPLAPRVWWNVEQCSNVWTGDPRFLPSSRILNISYTFLKCEPTLQDQDSHSSTLPRISLSSIHLNHSRCTYFEPTTASRAISISNEYASIAMHYKIPFLLFSHFLIHATSIFLSTLVSNSFAFSRTYTIPFSFFSILFLHCTLSMKKISVISREEWETF